MNIRGQTPKRFLINIWRGTRALVDCFREWDPKQKKSFFEVTLFELVEIEGLMRPWKSLVGGVEIKRGISEALEENARLKRKIQL